MPRAGVCWLFPCMGTFPELKSFLRTHYKLSKAELLRQGAGGRGVGPVLCQPPPSLSGGPAVAPAFGGEAGRVRSERKSTHQPDGVLAPTDSSVSSARIGNSVPLFPAHTPRLQGHQEICSDGRTGGSFKSFCLCICCSLDMKCFLWNLLPSFLRVENPHLAFQPQLTG